MPPVTRKPSQVKAVAQMIETQALPQKIIYKTIAVNGVDIPIRVLTEADAKRIVGWETEEEYSKRVGFKTEFGEEYLLKDISGKKIRCRYNNDNRPFTESWAKELAQSLLSREWADSRNGFDMTVNGETIIITRTGKVDSGQHRLFGLIFACEEWRQNKARWIATWPEEPTMEALVVTGVSDNPKVTQTLDNVKPRTLSDIFFTSPLFRNLASVERKECSRMLSFATDLLWERTRAANSFIKYQTHSASIDWVERHPKVLDCIKYIFEKNKERSLSLLRLSAGNCAGLLYLMGSSASNEEEYVIGTPPSEKLLNWENWERACEFWSLLADTKDDTMKMVRDTIASLVDADTGLGGRVSEKHAILCKAWNRYLNGEAVLVTTPALEYVRREDGRILLAERPNVAGIDAGPKPTGQEATSTPSPEEIAAQKLPRNGKRLSAPKPPEPVKLTPAQLQLKKGDDYIQKLDALNKLKSAHPGKVLLFKMKSGDYLAWMSDATTIAILMGGKTTRHESGMHNYKITTDKYVEAVRKLTAENRQIALVKEEDGKETVVNLKLN